MNPIIKIYNDLTNDELIILLEEIKLCEKIGSFPENANIRQICRKVADITKMDTSSNLLHTQIGILKEAAYRWLEII